MNAGLRELLGLPELRRREDDNQKNGLGKAFRNEIAGLNGDLQLVAAYADPAVHQKFDAQRQDLYAAYQNASNFDSRSASERVIAAAAGLKDKVSAQAANAQVAKEDWLRREAAFNDALVKIAECEDAGHPKADSFRKLGDAIQDKANDHDYGQASAALDQLLPKLDEAYLSLASATDRSALDGNSSTGVPGNQGILMAAPSGGGGQESDNRKAKTSKPPVSSDLPKKAKVTLVKMGQAQYDFGRPISQEQAAQVIFVDGKVPSEAKLEKGPGENVWTLRTFDMDGHQATLKKMKGRTETLIPGKPNTDKTTWNPPEPDTIIVEWSDVPIKSTGPKRRDLNNDLGFKITKKYPLDEGQSPNDTVKSKYFGKGHGYELVFEKPVTKAQVMDILFGGKSLGTGAVKLIPTPHEPTTMWQFHLIGIDAISALKKPAADAFSDASVYAEDSIEPSVPAGIREHIQKKTVSKDAKHHSPDVYVWEQEGFIIRVETDGKGKYYSHETTRIDHGDEAGKITIRYFMIEEGMKSREAWQEFIKHWEWIHMQMIAGLALALASGKLPGRVPSVKPSVTPRRLPAKNAPTAAGAPKQPAVATKAPTNPPKPTTNPGTATTQPGPPQRPAHGHPLDSTVPGPNQRQTVATGSSGGGSSGGGSQGGPPKKYNTMAPKKLPANQQITINTPNGPKQMTVGEYRNRVRDANKWVNERFNNKGVDSKQLVNDAAEKYGLDKNWRSINNPYVY